MARRRLPKASRRSSTRSSNAAAIISISVMSLLSTFVAPIAAASTPRLTQLTLGKEGIGAWNVLGPFSNLENVPESGLPLHGEPSGDKWQLMLSNTATFDFRRSLQLSSSFPQTVLVENTVALDRPFDGWLLVSADGAFSVSVDGRRLYRRQHPHQRGRSVEPVPLALTTGQHRLVIALEKRDRRATFWAGLRDRESFAVPSSIALTFEQSRTQSRVLSALLRLKLEIATARPPHSLTVKLDAPAVVPVESLAVAIALRTSGGQLLNQWPVQRWTPNEPYVSSLGPISELPLDLPAELLVEVGDTRFSQQLLFSANHRMCLDAALQALSGLSTDAATVAPFDSIRASIEYHVSQLLDAATRAQDAALDRAALHLCRFADALRSNQSPFSAPGWLEVALRSPYDAQPHPVLVQVPDNKSTSQPERGAPLVVALHGYDGNPRRILDAFLDNRGPRPTVPGFVIAPEAYGNAFYRGAAEQAVLDAVDWATQVYPIDLKRVSITGVSMGGTGAAELAFRHSSRFSAAAPLCGYHSFFARTDMRGKRLRPWEKHLMHQFSPASWVESGHDVPLYVAHGTKDVPLENSKVLTRRYQALGYHLEQDWPDVGHNVWTKTYRNAALFPWLAKWIKNTEPRAITLTTSQLRTGQKFWLEITRFEPASELPSATAKVIDPHRVQVTTRALLGFCLHNSMHIDNGAFIEVTIDGHAVAAPPLGRRCFEKQAGLWQFSPVNAPPDGLLKSAGVEGPWSDLLAKPAIVVYGTQLAATAELNRFVATRLFEPRSGVTVRIPVVSDQEYESMAQQVQRAIYVGTPEDHLQFARVADRLPIQERNGSLSLGSTRFDEHDVGTVFVYPDPDHRDRLLGFVTANGPEGLLRALSLPVLVPDFVVFDHGLDAAAGEPVLGPAAYVRAAGFFRSDWSIPTDFVDPLAPSRSH